jgi:hypothetical protein
MTHQALDRRHHWNVNIATVHPALAICAGSAYHQRRE